MDVDDQPNEMEDVGKSMIIDEASIDRSTRGILGESDQRIPGPPKCAKAQPSPRPPSTYTKDRPRLASRLDSIKEMMTDVGSEKEKGKSNGCRKGKGDSKGGGKSANRYKGMKSAKTDDADSVYTNQTVRGKKWGIAKDQRK